MVNIISKQYEVLATKLANAWQEDHFFKARIILTLLSVIALSIFLALVTLFVYLLFIQQPLINQSSISTPLLSSETVLTTKSELLHEARESLLQTMLMVNILMIILTISPIYILTRRVLAPIEHSNTQQKQLIANVSHELRTPLAIMLSSIDSALLNKNIGTLCKKVLQTHREDTLYLKKITDDLLMLEKLGMDQKYIASNLSDICTQSTMMIQAYAANKNISCTLSDTTKSSPIVHANRVQLQRLILNILKNSVDYSQPDTAVHISLHGKDAYVLLIITDEGIGMHEKELQYITKRFYKADTARTNSGAGLGLALVAEIAKAHGAKLSIESEESIGTTVTVQFPLTSS